MMSDDNQLPIQRWFNVEGDYEPEDDTEVIGWDWENEKAVCVVYVMNGQFVGVAATGEEGDIQVFYYADGAILKWQPMPPAPFGHQLSSSITH